MFTKKVKKNRKTLIYSILIVSITFCLYSCRSTTGNNNIDQNYDKKNTKQQNNQDSYPVIRKLSASEELFLAAVRNNDVRQIVYLLELGVNPEIKNNNGENGVYIASCNGKPDALKLLLNLRDSSTKGVAASEEDISMTCAVIQDFDDIVGILLDNGAKAEIVTTKNSSHLIQIAAKNGNAKMIKMLLKKGANPNITDINGQTALHIAVQKNHVEATKVLIEGGAKIDIKEKMKGETPLHYSTCMSGGQIEILNLLIKGGADINTGNNKAITPLHCTSGLGLIEKTSILIAKKAQINVEDKWKRTPLDHATFHNNSKIVKMLIDAGANVNNINEYGQTPLLIATKKNYIEVVNILLKNYADPNIRTTSNLQSPLHEASKRGHDVIATMLIKNKAKIDQQNYKKETPLNIATKADKKEVAKMLILSSAKVDIPDNEEMTPLHYAVKNQNIDLVKLLILNNANVNSKNKSGVTPLHYAGINGDQKIIKILLDAGANKTIKDHKRKTFQVYNQIYNSNKSSEQQKITQIGNSVTVKTIISEKDDKKK